jgi:hypothetical protein
MHPVTTTLSSEQTFFMKFILPILWIGLFAPVTFSWLFSPDSERKWGTLGVALAGAISIGRTCIGLKRVRMDDHALYISNYSTEIVVPLENVVAITEIRWVRIHPVTIVFRSETAFGSRITLMPPWQWLAYWSSPPVVAQIRDAVDRAAGRDPGKISS